MSKKSLIKTLSEIDIKNVEELEEIYLEYLNSHQKLKKLFEIFLENYKKCEKNHIDILQRTKEAIRLLKAEESNDENLIRLEIADKIVTQLLSNTKPLKKTQIQPYVKEVFLPFAALLNIFTFFGITEKRIKESCIIDNGYFCHIVEFLLGTKKDIDTYTKKIPIDTLVLIILIFLLFIFIVLFKNNFLAAVEIPLPGSGAARFNIKNPDPEPKFKSKSPRKPLRKSVRKSLRKSVRKSKQI
jgi:hypothetical protein